MGSDDPSSIDVASPQPPAGRRWRALPLLLLVTTLVGATTVAGWVGTSGKRAAEHLNRAGALFVELQHQLERSDPAAGATLERLRRATRAARADTDGIAWRRGGRTPWIGNDLAAVRTVAVTVDDLARDGLPHLVETAGRVNLAALAPRAGRVELGSLEQSAGQLDAADAAVRRAYERIAALHTGGLHPRLRSAVDELRDGLRRAAGVTGTSARTAALLPGMLGSHGPRTYLVLFQNLAEVRATGGLPGAFAILGTDRGDVRIIEQGAVAQLGAFPGPVLPLDPAMRALYTDRQAIYPGNVNVTPHFPTAATLIREMYRRRTGRTVDGVVATDPVALSYLLRSVGPVRAPDGGTLTADNAVRSLLVDVYARFRSNPEQDRYFAGVAGTVFDALTRTATDPRALLGELARAAGERRILVWSAHPGEQRRIAGTVLEGALPTADGADPLVGVFLNDGTGAKLSYYLTQAVDVRVGACRPGGYRELAVRLTLGSTAPNAGLSPSVLGLALGGAPYIARTNVLVFSPTSGAVEAVRLDGARVAFGSGTERGRAVAVVTVDLPPGASRTVEFDVLTGPTSGTSGGSEAAGQVSPRLWTTPTARPVTRSIGSAAPC